MGGKLVTLLERGTDDPLKREKWEQSREALEAVQAQREQAEGALKVFRQRVLAPKEKELNEAEQQRQEEWNRLIRTRNIKAGTACLGYALGAPGDGRFLSLPPGLWESFRSFKGIATRFSGRTTDC